MTKPLHNGWMMCKKLVVANLFKKFKFMRLLARHFNSRLWNKLDKYEVLVLCVLAGYSNRGDKCFPSYTKLRKTTKLMRNTISKALTGLKEKGAIDCSEGKGTVNKYDLSLWNDIK